VSHEPDPVIRDLMRTCLHSACDTPPITFGVKPQPFLPVYYCGLRRPGKQLCVLATQTCMDAEPFPEHLDT